MSSNTRMKKYENLRQSILEETKDVVETPKLSRFAKRLNTIDAEYFQPMVDPNVVSETPKSKASSVLDPLHAPLKPVSEAPSRSNRLMEEKTVERNSFFDEEEILARAMRLSTQDSNGSDDDMLNQFLKEIRSYNKKQGVRSQEDTKLEILKQVRMDHEQESSKQKQKESSDTLHQASIARQVKELIQAEREEGNDGPTWQRKNDQYENSLEQERAHRAKLLEETQQLRLQLSEHEEDLDEIGTGIDYTRKLLNVLVALCLVAVVIAGAILGYLLVKG